MDEPTARIRPQLINYPPRVIHCCLSSVEFQHVTTDAGDRLLFGGGALVCWSNLGSGEQRQTKAGVTVDGGGVSVPLARGPAERRHPGKIRCWCGCSD